MTVPLAQAVLEAVDLGELHAPIDHLPDDVAAARGPDIDCKMTTSHVVPLSFNAVEEILIF